MGPFSILDRNAMRREARAGAARARQRRSSRTRLVGALSGGERQLVAVARALQFQPRLLLMDEPTAALSAEKIRVVMGLIEELKARGVSILLISHRFTDILHVCDRIVVLRQGLIAGELAAARPAARADDGPHARADDRRRARSRMARPSAPSAAPGLARTTARTT